MQSRLEGRRASALGGSVPPAPCSGLDLASTGACGGQPGLHGHGLPYPVLGCA